MHSSQPPNSFPQIWAARSSNLSSPSPPLPSIPARRRQLPSSRSHLFHPVTLAPLPQSGPPDPLIEQAEAPSNRSASQTGIPCSLPSSAQLLSDQCRLLRSVIKLF